MPRRLCKRDPAAIVTYEEAVTDRFKERHECAASYLPCFLIKEFYAKAEEEMPLRGYIVGSFLCTELAGFKPNCSLSIAILNILGNCGFQLECYKLIPTVVPSASTPHAGKAKSSKSSKKAASAFTVHLSEGRHQPVRHPRQTCQQNACRRTSS